MSKTPINTILKWLSVADMFVMIEYIPFTIYTTYIRPSKIIHASILSRVSQNSRIPFAHCTPNFRTIFYFVLFFRSRRIELFVGCICIISYAFYTNFAYNIDIIDRDTGIMAIYCDQVSCIRCINRDCRIVWYCLRFLVIFGWFQLANGLCTTHTIAVLLFCFC